MKAVLYCAYDLRSLHGTSAPEWRISIDPTLEADKSYWRQRCGAARLLRRKEPLPYNRALMEAEAAAEAGKAGACGKPGALSPSLRTTDADEVGERAGSAGSAGEACTSGAADEAGKVGACGKPGALSPSLRTADAGRREPILPSLSVGADEGAAYEPIPLSPQCHVDGGGEFGDRAAAGCDSELTGWADKLASVMEGRSLLSEELESLLAYTCGDEAAAAGWKRVAQLAYLRGGLVFDTSVALHGRTGWRGLRLRKPAAAECRRCGSQGASLRWTPCASCGELCPYCEVCLTMGRARLCAPLFLGRANPVAPSQRHPQHRGQEPASAPVRSEQQSPLWTIDPAAAGPADLAVTLPIPSPVVAAASSPHGGTASASSLVARSVYGSAASEPGASMADEWLRVTAPLPMSVPIPIMLPDLRLSPAQTAAAEAGVKFVEEGWSMAAKSANGQIRRFLIWAVTGAGKTEMIYPLVAAERRRGGRVLIATPRKDVVLELLPRVQSTFPGERLAALYGGSAERWASADITVATTHQLLRYEAAFDLVVLDEIDAFPYHGDPMLAYAARKACKPGASLVMLSATPPPELQRAARSGRSPHVKVPVRYHRHPLPVPGFARPARLAALLRESLARGAQAFVFVPQIARLVPELRRLRQQLSAHAEPGHIDATSSQDPDRADKVLRLRSGDIRVLLTTTILERGVTISKADVFVLGADSRLFDAAALVQMAGRAGRSAMDPCGRVRFLAKQRTRAQAEAVRQIRAMNRLARRNGYLLEP